MALKKILGLERREHPRHDIAVDVEFHVWDEVSQKPLTGKYAGELTNISLLGACLQTSHILIAGHHLMIHNDVEGKTPLFIYIPAAPGESSFWKIKANVIWYKKAGEERKFLFDVGLEFRDVTEDARKNLKALMQSSNS